jgi:hypothetical protein
MRVETTTTELYKFEELSSEAKETVVSGFYDINLYDEWWDGVYEDASQCDIKITSFDLDRNRHCRADIPDVDETANIITCNHGEMCGTYSVAKEFQEAKAKILEAAPKDEEGEYVDEYVLDCELDDLADEFRRNICEEYAYMLQKEYEYLGSVEAIIDSIKANEYEFTVDGILC